MSEDRAASFQRFRAPHEDGEALFVPALDEWSDQVVLNRQILRKHAGPTLAGVSWPDLARRAREDLLQSARQYSQRPDSVNSSPDLSALPIVLSGHQPTLFHPGVWVKNFVLSELAQRVGGLAVHIVIDNDVVGDPSIQVPSGNHKNPALSTIPIDSPDPRIPFEEWKVVDQGLVESFAARVTEASSPWLSNTLLSEVWPALTAQLNSESNVAQLIARTRHQLEAQLGLDTQEVPLSHICQGEAFALLASELMEKSGAFQEAYNSSLEEYRQAQRISSKNRPAADLASQGEFREVPFWLWSEDQPERRRAFVRSKGCAIQLTDLEGVDWTLPIPSESTAEEIVASFSQAAAEGIRIRPRALTTTLFARLLLGDLFIHGIGGAKYDQVTDRIIERFFRLPPPLYTVASATFRLPLPLPKATDQQLEEIRRQLRDLEHSPELALQELLASGQAEAERGRVEPFLAAKKELLEKTVEADQRRAWHEQLQHVNGQLAQFTGPQREQLLGQQDSIERQLEQGRIFSSREFSWGLFSGETLFPQLLEFVTPSP